MQAGCSRYVRSRTRQNENMESSSHSLGLAVRAVCTLQKVQYYDGKFGLIIQFAVSTHGSSQLVQESNGLKISMSLCCLYLSC